MGETAYVKTKPAADTLKKASQRFFKVDIMLVVVTIMLMIFGLVMVYSSSWNFSILADDSTNYAVKRQAFWLVIGTGAAIFCSFLDYHRYKKIALPALLVSVLSLFAALFFPANEFGARRTLFGGSVQPSELAKLLTIVYISVWLYSKRERLNNIFFGLIPLGMIVGLVGGLILAQPDLSAAITIILLGGVLFYMADAEIRQIILVVLLIALVGFFFIMISSNGRERLIDYWNGLQDPTSASDHVRYSLRAIVEGGLFGKGLGKGTIKVIGLPVAWTDSIYAVIAEELGIVGAGVIMVMYIIILWRGISIAQKAPDQLGRLLAGGIIFWITWEAIINMGVMVNVFPFAGNALPLISTGGSSLVSVLVAIGILLNISRAGYNQPEQTDRRFFGASLGKRRRDRRRRVSRPNRTASSRNE
jgi:cell division protein FtsW